MENTLIKVEESAQEEIHKFTLEVGMTVSALIDIVNGLFSRWINSPKELISGFLTVVGL
jgi:hypothetical protein